MSAPLFFAGVGVLGAVALITLIVRGPDDPPWPRVLAEAVCCGAMVGGGLGAVGSWLVGVVPS